MDMKDKTVKKTGCDVCPWKGKKIIKPEDWCDNPDLLIMAEAPGKTENEKEIPLIGESGQIIRALLKKHYIKNFVLFNAVQCFDRQKPPAKVINACRQEFVIPLLETYPNVPILVLGEYAAKSLLGNTNKARFGEVCRTYKHDCYFAYHPAYYLRSGKDKSVLDNIETMLKSAISKQKFTLNIQKDIDAFDILSSEYIIVDIETTGKNYPWYGDKLLLTGIMTDEDKIYPITDTNLIFLNDYKGLIIGHNLMFDLGFLSYYGVKFDKAKFYDTKIALKFETGKDDNTSLKYVIKERFGVPGYEAEVNAWIKEHNSLENFCIDKLIEYNAYDLIYTKMLWENINVVCQKPFTVSMDYMHYIVDMVDNGMVIDLIKTKEIKEEYEKKIEEKALDIAKITGIQFNPNSWLQIQEMFKRLYNIKLADTTAATLEKYNNQYPLAKEISGYRSLTHFKNTFCDGYLKWVDGSVIHSKFKVEGAITGRMTSSSPNLQNDDPKIREIFVSRYQNGSLICSDLSNAQYRAIAHLSQDKLLIDLFNKGIDIHKAAYADVFCVDYNDVTPEQRFLGKNGINYPIVFGQGEDAFFEKIGEVDYALYERIKNRYPGVNVFRDRFLLKLRKTHKAISIFGRMWVFDKITPDIERDAFNYIIQSFDHDILQLYIMEVMDSVENGVLLINEKHDSFVLDCPRDLVKTSVNIVEEIGCDLNPLIEKYFGIKMLVPFYAECKVVTNLGKT